MRILMIEDDTELCEMVQFALAKEGYTVDVCHEGDDGLRWMKERAHDLVLLDRMLPRMDGGTILKQARAAGIHTPVLMITALGSVSERILLAFYPDPELDAGAQIKRFSAVARTVELI